MIDYNDMHNANVCNCIFSTSKHYIKNTCDMCKRYCDFLLESLCSLRGESNTTISDETRCMRIYDDK